MGRSGMVFLCLEKWVKFCKLKQQDVEILFRLKDFSKDSGLAKVWYGGLGWWTTYISFYVHYLTKQIFVHIPLEHENYFSCFPSNSTHPRNGSPTKNNLSCIALFCAICASGFTRACVVWTTLAGSLRKPWDMFDWSSMEQAPFVDSIPITRNTWLGLPSLPSSFIPI